LQTKLLIKQIDLNIIYKFARALKTTLKPPFVRISFFFGLNIVVSVLTLLWYYSPYVSPDKFWPSSFLPLLIPLLIFINLVFCIVWLFKYPKNALLSLIVLIIGYTYVFRTYAIHNGKSKMDEAGLRVLSYNVRVFNVYDHLKDPDFASSKNILNWLAAYPADILCLQEFYNLKHDTLFDAVEKIRRNHPYYNVKSFFVNESIGASFGIAIFSKLPIVNKGMLEFKEKTNNQILFADIKIGKDTIRIYNMHLQSMSFEEHELTIDGNYKTLLRKFRDGSIQRSRQIQVLKKHIAECSLNKIIICGDLNDTPFSYSYQALKDDFNNSFEKAGDGFGLTYNGNLFLRIDNQFASKDIKVRAFKVHKEIKYSDHFPIEGIYSIN
jgi:endonuclease/exonuclease/phosphatase family metal-dependent hydrolase